MNLRRATLLVLPWLLLVAMTGFAAIGWTHFLAKDKALWLGAFEAIASDTAALVALESGEIAEASARLQARRAEHCAWIARYAEHAVEELHAALAQAQATCASARVD